MTLITFHDGKVVLRDGKVGTEAACCCGPVGVGVCCVNGQCDGSYTTQEACEQCDPIFSPGGFLLGFEGPCGKWIADGDPADCGQPPWRCEALPDVFCISGLPAPFNNPEQFTNSFAADAYDGNPTDTLYVQGSCGRWKLIGVVSDFSVPNVTGINGFLPATPDGDCFPATAQVVIFDELGRNETVTITITEGPCP